MTITTTQQIIYIASTDSSADTPASDKTYLIVQLDAIANTDADTDEVKTEFFVGSKAYIQVFSHNYTLETSLGTLTQEKTGKSYSVEETLSFANEKEKTLTYFPVGNVTFSWSGKDSSTPSISGRRITFTTEQLGILTCTYTASYDQWSLTYDAVGTAIVIGIRGVGEDKIERSIEVPFSAHGHVTPTVKTGLQLILDSARNDNQTQFEPRSFAFLLCYHENLAAYVIETSGGSASVIARDVSILVVDELVRFENSATGSMDYPSVGSISYEWVGPNKGFPSFNGQTVTMNKAITGILKCSYATLADRIRLFYDSTGTIIVIVIQTIRINNVDIEYTASQDVIYAEAVSVEPVIYELNIRNYCSDDNVAGVEVFLDGTSLGTTDSSGIISLGELIPGSTHTLKMIKTGYIDSDQDKLLNDSFTVPERTTS